MLGHVCLFSFIFLRPLRVASFSLRDGQKDKLEGRIVTSGKAPPWFRGVVMMIPLGTHGENLNGWGNDSLGHRINLCPDSGHWLYKSTVANRDIGFLIRHKGGPDSGLPWENCSIRAAWHFVSFLLQRLTYRKTAYKSAQLATFCRLTEKNIFLNWEKVFSNWAVFGVFFEGT